MRLPHGHQNAGKVAARPAWPHQAVGAAWRPPATARRPTGASPDERAGRPNVVISTSVSKSRMVRCLGVHLPPPLHRPPTRAHHPPGAPALVRRAGRPSRRPRPLPRCPPAPAGCHHPLASGGALPPTAPAAALAARGWGVCCRTARRRPRPLSLACGCPLWECRRPAAAAAARLHRPRSALPPGPPAAAAAPRAAGRAWGGHAVSGEPPRRAGDAFGWEVQMCPPGVVQMRPMPHQVVRLAAGHPQPAACNPKRERGAGRCAPAKQWVAPPPTCP